MKTHCFIIVSMGLVPHLVACGSDSDKDNGAQGTGGETMQALEDGGVPMDGEYHELMGYEWTADPGVEAYWCGYKTLTEDLYVSAFRPNMPDGTHHVTLGYQDPVVDDGYVPGVEGTLTTDPTVCTGISFGDVFSFVGTVGTQALEMPEGVAVKIPAGKQLVFGLHVLNATAEPVTERAGIEIITPAKSDVVHEAEVIAAQALQFEIPPGESTVHGTCTMVEDATVFAVMPHMHKAGVHMTSTAGPDGVGATLLDADYEFTEQVYTVFDDPIQLNQGDKINIACDYANPGTEPLTPGESTDKNEMCITFAYRYPAVAMKYPVDTSLGIPLPRGWCVY